MQRIGRPTTLTLAALVALIFFSVTFAATGRRARPAPAPAPAYDKSQEVQLQGAVEDIKDPVGPAARSPQQQIVLQTAAGSVLVQLAPSSFLKSQDFVCTKGDVLEVVGARVLVQNQEIVLAREVRMGEQVVTLRDADGHPEWLRKLQEARMLSHGGE